jgi:hypothetical protein
MMHVTGGRAAAGAPARALQPRRPPARALAAAADRTLRGPAMGPRARAPPPPRAPACAAHGGSGSNGNGAASNGAASNGATSNGAPAAAAPTLADRLRATATPPPPHGSGELDFYMLGGMDDLQRSLEEDVEPGSPASSRAPSPGGRAGTRGAGARGARAAADPWAGATREQIAAERQRRLRRSVFSFER